MQYPLCRHVKTNGIRCQSPSLETAAYCYFHNRLHDRHRPFRFPGATRGYLMSRRDIELTALEDRESVQLALSVVINALATGQIEQKRAAILLYGLQIAGGNVRRLDANPSVSGHIRAIESTPEGLDLAEAEATLETLEINNQQDPNENPGKADKQNEEAQSAIPVNVS